METIRLAAVIEKPMGEVFEMLSTLGGLRSWLSRDTTGVPKKGGEIRLGFGQEHFTTLEVMKSSANRSLSWALSASTFSKDGEGIGTRIAFKLAETQERGTRIELEHGGWEGVTEFYRLSGYQWEAALASLKKACETGYGDPITPKMLASRKASGWFPVA